VAKKTLTLIVVPDHTAEVRRFQLDTSLLRHGAIGLGAAVLVLLIGVIHYFTLVREASENRVLRDENLTLRTQLKSIRERMDHIGATLERVERFDQKLRAVTLLSDPQRNLALGPTAGEPGVTPTPSAETEFTRAQVITETPKNLAAKLDRLSESATKREQSLQELQAYFLDQKSRLASTPSVWPARGWVTSDFGQRTDPYTAERVMHEGLDIAAPHGKEVVAPSDGTVIFAGLEGGYGNVLVIDHGYGVKTRYGHLSKLEVKTGEHVNRGQLVGAVGNTGRSTGPHLHYEVRVNGIPENPKKFILED
jgi:murein DD-endopeptidase MepM/ murein hydrolase activator NlpD